MMSTLHGPFERSAGEHPGKVALIDSAHHQSVTYEQLDRVTDRLAEDLTGLGVAAGRRVGIHAPKSIPTVAAILATLKAGGVYVPVDSTAPARRGAEILGDCDVTAIVLERGLVQDLCAAWEERFPLHEFDATSQLSGLGCDLVVLTSGGGKPSPVEELAYILYTSGSTGKPKGVMHTHASARCFVDWCSGVFTPTSNDRFSSHAPFHFDLSILDLFVPLAHGGAVVLIGEEDSKNPLRLAPLIADNGVSVWYSTPSVLRLLVEHAGLERHEVPDLRLVLFAGEVFGPGHLRRLQAVWSDRRYFNLYGPTETNVCTYYEVIGDVPPDRGDPYPIGKPIEGDQTMVVGTGGSPVSRGEEGELLVTGGTVMAGYWNRPDLDERAFLLDSQGRKWYRTGDLVREDEAGDYLYIGRRDRMIKRRGYRVELGEIEATLYRSPHVRETAVVALPDPEGGSRVQAFVCWRGEERPSSILLKRFCAENLPLYMVPDSFTFLDELPKTSTDKMDYVAMKELHA